MTRNQLFTSLNKLCNEMDYSYDTSCGGCCFVTACLAENLERNNIPFKVVVVYNPTHYYIKVSDRYINRCDFIKLVNPSLYYTYYNSERLYNIYYSEDWNPCYKRRWNLIVQTRIRALFRKYENSRA